MWVNMSTLKDLLLDFDDSYDEGDGSVEVFADSVRQALELAAQELNVDIYSLDYEILEKGTKGFFGIGRQPYRIVVTPLNIGTESEADTDLDELDIKLSGATAGGLKASTDRDFNGSFKIRTTKTGVWLSVTAPSGGKKVAADEVENACYSMRLDAFDTKAVRDAVAAATGEKVRIADWKPNLNYDGTMRVEIAEDEMKAYVYFTVPKYTGRHMDYDDVVEGLRNSGVVSGIRNDDINNFLDEMTYTRPLLAAEGQQPRNGNDAYIDFKVRVDKSKIKFEEDDSGKVDFRNLELLENVVVGQLLAVKVPAGQGIPGRTITNRVLPARSGKDTAVKFGKGTILSEDGTELTAEINGQVVYKAGRITVEPVYIVTGDVSLETGNIVFLGSVIVQGSVQDNFEVKAAGNIEVKGTVQKAYLESEGDIVVHQGISGKDEAKVESTGGSVFAKFIQNSNIVAEKNVIVPEGVLHSRVDAGERIYSIGRRAKIAGGVIRAGDEVNARFLGAEGGTKTVIRVGVNPKILQQLDELVQMKTEMDDELKTLRLDLKTLETQKRNSGGLSEEKEKLLSDMSSRESKLSERYGEIAAEVDELNTYIEMLEHKGKICAEKVAYPGVEVYIKDKDFMVRDEYNHVKFSLEGGEIYISDYEPPAQLEGTQRISTLVASRRR